MVSAIIAAAIVSVMGITMVNRAITHTRQQRLSTDSDQAWYLANAGLEACLGKIRWDSVTWGAVKNADSNQPCANGSLAGGTYSALARRFNPAMPGVILITATGSFAGYTRSLQATAQWRQPNPGIWANRADFLGGGSWRFSGNSHIQGTLASTGNVDFGGSATICGSVWANGLVTPPGAVDCGATFEHANVVVDYVDPLNTFEKTFNGNLTCDDRNCDLAYGSVKITGTLTIGANGNRVANGFGPQTTVVACKIVINGNVSSLVGGSLRLYAKRSACASPPPAGTDCTDYPLMIDASLNQATVTNVILWTPDGRIEIKGSQSNSYYGQIYGQCVEVESSGNIDFMGGANEPPGSGGIDAPAGASFAVIGIWQP